MLRFQLPRLQTESEAYLHLDALRFIAAMGIVVHHYREDWIGNRFAMTHLNALNLFVDLFFAISGVVIMFVYGDRVKTFGEFKTFMKRRAARLVPLHWLTLFFFVAVAIAAMKGWAPKSDHYDWACLPWNIVLLHSTGVCRSLSFNYVSWSVSAEMIVYLMFPLILLLFRKSAWLPFGLGLVVLTTMYLTKAPRPWWEWTYDFGVFRAIAGFCVGVGIYGAKIRLARLIPVARFWLVATLAIFLSGMILGVGKGFLVLLTYAIVALGVAADHQKIAGPGTRLIAPLGSLTFGIYMIHPAVKTVFITVMGGRLLHLTGWKMNLLVLMSGLITVGAAYGSKFFFEDPCRRWISALGTHRVPVAVNPT